MQRVRAVAPLPTAPNSQTHSSVIPNPPKPPNQNEQDSIQRLSRPCADADDDVAAEVSKLLPRGARRQLAHLAAARREAREAGLAGLAALGSGSFSTQPGSPLAAAPAASGRSGLGGGLFGFVTGGFAASAQRQASGSPKRAAARGAGGALSSQGSNGSSAQPPVGTVRAGSGLVRAATLARADTGKSVGDWAAATGGGAFDGEMAPLLRHIARLRARGQLLHPDEWRAYAQVGRAACARMARSVETCAPEIACDARTCCCADGRFCLFGSQARDSTRPRLPNARPRLCRRWTAAAPPSGWRSRPG